MFQFEVDSADEISERTLLDELFPKVVEKTTFAKPSRPGKGIIYS